MTVTRLAPSPTGFLHLGNAWSFVAAHCIARKEGGRIVFRSEDIDPARARREYEMAAIRDLAWLGIGWDQGPEAGPLVPCRQSERQERYRERLDWLRARKLVYPCFCTRKELRALAGAPHVEDFGAPYPGTCAALSDEAVFQYTQSGRSPAFRLRCPTGKWLFTDMICGPQEGDLATLGGDFALRRSDGVFAYQLAVVIDDIDMGVDLVVRGRDILPSTFRQLYLYSLLGAEPPSYAHVPLVLDHEGERLAKRHGALTLGALREAGVLPETIVGFLLAMAGLIPCFRPVTAVEAVEYFVPAQVPNQLPPLAQDPVAHLLRLQKGG